MVTLESDTERLRGRFISLWPTGCLYDRWSLQWSAVAEGRKLFCCSSRSSFSAFDAKGDIMYHDSAKVRRRLIFGMRSLRLLVYFSIPVSSFIIISGLVAGEWKGVLLTSPFWVYYYGYAHLLRELLTRRVVIEVWHSPGYVHCSVLATEHSFSADSDGYILEGVQNFIVIVKNPRTNLLFIPRCVGSVENVTSAAVESATGLRLVGSTRWDLPLRLM